MDVSLAWHLTYTRMYLWAYISHNGYQGTDWFDEKPTSDRWLKGVNHSTSFIRDLMNALLKLLCLLHCCLLWRQYISLFVKRNLNCCFESFSGVHWSSFFPLVMEQRRSSSESGRKLISLYTKKVKNGIFMKWKTPLSNARKKDLRASYWKNKWFFVHSPTFDWKSAIVQRPFLIKEEHGVSNYNQMQVIASCWLTVSKDNNELIFTNLFFILPWNTSCHSPVGSTLK